MSCQRSLPKGELLRLVRTANGEVALDPTTRFEGRGAYVCPRSECAEKLTGGRPLARSFRAPVKLQQETIDLVREWQRSAFTR